MNIPAIIAISIMIIVFLIVSIFIFMKFSNIKKKYKGYKKVKGKCVDYNKVFKSMSVGDVREWWKYPIVVYEVDNKLYQITSNVAYSLGFPLKNRKFTVFYNPNNPKDAILADNHRLVLFIFVGFFIGVLFMLYFLINNVILDNALKYYEYKVTCNVSGHVYTETGGVDAKSEEEALELFKEKFKEKYKFWDENCKFQEVSKSSDK